MNRFDLYATVHKGLRAALTAAAVRIAQTDFSRPEEVAPARAELQRVLGFLTEHLAHEDEFILPELQRLAPELHIGLHNDHVRTAGLEHELARLLARLESASDAERLALGHRIHGRVWALVAEHLRHMECEETQANRIFWAHCSDTDLLAIQARIVAAMPPARLQEWLDLILPAVHSGERAELGAMPC